MATDDSNARIPSGNLLAKLGGIISLKLRVRPDQELGVVEILFTNVPDRCSLTLTPDAALRLALGVGASIARLRGWEAIP